MRDLDRLTQAGKILRQVESALRVTKLISWPASTKARFFARGACELPRATYHIPSMEKVHAGAKEARRLVLGSDPAHQWMRRQAETIRRAARMLEAAGTKAFTSHSAALYGTPGDTILDQPATPLMLARRIERLLHRLDPEDLGSEPEPLSARELAARIQERCREMMGKDAPSVVVVKGLSAKATAGIRKIKVRADARFTKADVQQLLMHEAMVHVATTLNGRAQTRLPILAVRHPGTTRTQEGLAVFSELVSGVMSPARLRRLALRVIAIQLALDGADFLDLYRFFVERHEDEPQAYEDARRIVRGGLITGGAPFHKDGVYLDGLVRVHTFLRAAVELRRPDLMVLLYCGKLDLEDIPVLAGLAERGAIKAPLHLPPWLEDRRFVVSHLAYSGFLERFRWTKLRDHYSEILAPAPPCLFATPRKKPKKKKKKKKQRLQSEPGRWKQ